MKANTSSALLLVDVQVGMFESPLIPPVHDAARLLTNIVGLVERTRARELPVVFVQHCGSKGHPLEEGIPQWQIHPAVRPVPGELVIQKRFCDSFYKTDLHELLQARSVCELIVAGIQTELCVDTACRRACSLGYQVTLVEDAHSTWNNRSLKAEQIIRHHNETLGQQFVALAKSEALFNPVPAGRVAHR